MIRVSQNDSSIKVIFQRFKAHALNGTCRADRHEDGRVDDSASSSKCACAGLAVARYYLESDWGLGDVAIRP